MNNTTTNQFGIKKSLNKINSKIYKNIKSQREEQKIKHLLSNKSQTNLPPKTSKHLNPIQLKKTYRPSGQKTLIDCDISNINNNSQNSLKNQHKAVYDFLKDLNMEIYFENFIKNGINTQEKILYLNNDNLKIINMNYLYQMKTKKKKKLLMKTKIFMKKMKIKAAKKKLIQNSTGSIIMTIMKKIKN